MAATNAAKLASAKNAVSSDASDLVEDVKEIAQDAVDILEDSVEVVKRSWVANSDPKMLMIGAGLVGIAIGGALTYLAVSKRLGAKYQREADIQVEDVKNHYSLLKKDNVDLDALAEQYLDAEKPTNLVREEQAVAEAIVDRQGYTAYNKVPAVVEDPVIVEQTVTEAIVEATQPRELNLFESEMPDTYFIFSEELVRREEHPYDPFVITKQEFDENESGNEHADLTYFDGDDVLADDKGSPIEDLERTVGYENIIRFGHGSGDPKVVYVRNDRLGIDFEVAHSSGSFVKEVLNFDDSELQHSDRRIRRMRPERD